MPFQIAPLLLPGSPLLKFVYAGNMLWHTSALVHFGFRPEYIMRKVSLRKRQADPAISSSPGGDIWHHDILKYLGSMNSPLALLAGLRLFAIPLTREGNSLSLSAMQHIDVLALTVLGLANASQAFLNFTVGRNHDRWITGKGFDRITVFDALFTVLDWGCALFIAL